jgi:hypothetical protein
MKEREARTLILAKYNLADAKPTSISMDLTAQFSQNQSPTTGAEAAKMKNKPYRPALGL